MANQWHSRSLLFSFLLHFSISSNTFSALRQIYTIEVVNEYYHDTRAFTEGLLYEGNNTLYESTGLYGESSVRRVNLQTGKVEAFLDMSSSYFGEGLTLVGERLYQLTYDQNTGFIYDRTTLSKLENEYGDVESLYGIKGRDYINWTANIAVGLGAGVPWVMCKQTDAPEFIDWRQ